MFASPCSYKGHCVFVVVVLCNHHAIMLTIQTNTEEAAAAAVVNSIPSSSRLVLPGNHPQQLQQNNVGKNNKTRKQSTAPTGRCNHHTGTIPSDQHSRLSSITFDIFPPWTPLLAFLDGTLSHHRQT
jgi:hypothetical protein